MQKQQQHPPVVYAMMAALVAVVMRVNIGTNIGLLRTMWAIASGQLLVSRGAMIPALSASGLDPQKTRQAWAASCYGDWQINDLLAAWQDQAKTHCGWQASKHGDYELTAIDLVGIFRPKLKNCNGKHHDSTAGKALPAIELGMIAKIGKVNGKRQALLRQLVRVPDDAAQGHKALREKLVQTSRSQQSENEVIVADAEFTPHEMLKYGSGYFVVRGASNDTFATANTKAKTSAHGRTPTQREVVRPLARKGKRGPIPATPPDEIEMIEVTIAAVDERSGAIKREILTVEVKIWRNLRVSDNTLKGMDLEGEVYERVHDTPLMVAVITHPRFKKPMVLVSNLSELGSVIYNIYVDRWPIEGIPQCGKQILGGHREFVHNPEHRQRLPELTLLVGNMMATVAAGHEGIATGFWDKKPKATAGRLRRLLFRVCTMPEDNLPEQIREKKSCTSHLIKGHAAKLLKKPALAAAEPSI